MGDHNYPYGEPTPVGDELDSPRSPPPPTPDAPIPPPPAGTASVAPRNRSTKTRATISALFLALAGWGVWIYGWTAEIDTGYPDGLACTANPINSSQYESCMRSSERGGAIAWGLTLGAAVMALVILTRSRQALGFGRERMATISAWFTSTLLAVAGIGIWIRGAQGELYEDRIGASTWHLAMIIPIAVGLIAGWFFTRRRL